MMRRKISLQSDSAASPPPRKQGRIRQFFGRLFRSRWTAAAILVAVVLTVGYKVALKYSKCPPRICLSGIADTGDPRRFTKEAPPSQESLMAAEIKKCTDAYQAKIAFAPEGEAGRRIKGKAIVARNLCVDRTRKKYGGNTK